ncbi:unnamed protein product [Amoebophrya sp. A25]|nr:unnamed protein product [Amoebophrya sp. A25]|eukprot:GSA25T00010566001.1
MSAAVTSLVWVPKGRAKKRPAKWEATDEELKELEELYGIEGDIEEEEEKRIAADPRKKNKDVAEEDEAEDHGVEDDAEGLQGEDNAEGHQGEDDIDVGMDVEGQEEEGQAEEKVQEEDLASHSMLNVYSMNSAEEHEAALADPLLSPEQQDSDSDDDELLPSDNIFLATSCEDEQCTLEVFVYDQAEGAMFVHHDISLNAYPLCVDTVSLSSTPGRENLAAVGQFDCNIDIWNLDVLEPMAPVVTLSGGESAGGATKKKSKNKTTAKNHSTGGHTGAVMSVHSHPSEKHLLASGGADNLLKIWDIEQATCVHSFNHHEDKVQCARWHPSEQAVVLSAGYDRKVALLDVRKKSSAAVKMDLSADAEQACWNQEMPNLFYISTEDGQVSCFDARKVVATKEATSALWTLHCFQKGACSGLAQRKDVLLVGGTDGVAKVYDLRDLPGKQDVPVFEKTMAIGPIFACAGPTHGSNEDSMFLLSGHTVALWDLASEKALADRFGW